MSELIGEVDIINYENNFKTIVLSNGFKIYSYDKPFDPSIIDDVYEYEDRYQLKLTKRKEDEFR